MHEAGSCTWATDGRLPGRSRGERLRSFSGESGVEKHRGWFGAPCLPTRHSSNSTPYALTLCKASKSDQLVEGPARTARTVRARARISCVEPCSCRRCRARPVPCTLLDICMYYAATGRLEHARMTLHAYNGAGKMKTRAQPDSYAVTVCTCPHHEHAACIRRSLRAGACADDSAGVRMRTRTHSACAARFRTVGVGACITSCEQHVCHGQHGTYTWL